MTYTEPFAGMSCRASLTTTGTRAPLAPPNRLRPREAFSQPRRVLASMPRSPTACLPYRNRPRERSYSVTVMGEA